MVEAVASLTMQLLRKPFESNRYAQFVSDGTSPATLSMHTSDWMRLGSPSVIDITPRLDGHGSVES